MTYKSSITRCSHIKCNLARHGAMS